jgi:hypothetical protein
MIRQNETETLARASLYGAIGYYRDRRHGRDA